MGIDGLLKPRRDEILRIAALYGAFNLRVFGSVARGEARPDSDVDFLVEMEAGRSLFDLGGLLADLETLLGRKVDVAEPQGLHAAVPPNDQMPKCPHAVRIASSLDVLKAACAAARRAIGTR